MSLDAIDRAYIAHEFPLRIVRTRKIAPHERRTFLARLAHVSRSGALVLPPDTYVEIVAPQVPHPFELARWADDGGQV